MRYVLCLLACAFAAAPSDGTITGRAYDQTGGIVSGARVVLLEDFQKFAETKSGESGEFAFRGLKPGTYQVQIKQPYFQIFQQLVPLKESQKVHVYATLNVARIEDELAIGTDRLAGPPTAGTARAYTPGGRVEGPKRISGRMPAWPEAAARRGASGVVALSGVIRADGAVADIVVLDSPGPDLEKAAVDAYRTWKFEPMKLNGSPVESRHVLVLTFGRS